MVNVIYKYGVYEIKNIINGNLYIGSTAISFNKRWKEHINDLINNRHTNDHLQKAWNKYGKHNFEFNIIVECEDINDVLIIEQFYLDKYFDHNKKCYNINLMVHSCFGAKRTEETKKKQSIAKMGHNVSSETRKKFSVAKSKTNHPLFGKKHSLEARAKMRASHCGEKHNWYGKEFTQKHKDNISIAKTGKKRKPFTNEHKNNLKKPGHTNYNYRQDIDNDYIINSYLNGVKIKNIAQCLNVSSQFVRRRIKTYKKILGE